MKSSREKAQEYLKRFKETNDVRSLRNAIKNDHEILWNEDVKHLINSFLRYFAINPYRGKLLGLSSKEVQEFFDDLRLIKPEKKNEKPEYFLVTVIVLSPV